MVERIVATRMEPIRPSRTLMSEEVKGGGGKITARRGLGGYMGFS